MFIPIFFVCQWFISVFFQSFFLHRYCAHRMYTMSPAVERIVHFLTWVTMGSTYMAPKPYALLHREHHAYSDTPRDPHSPSQIGNLFTMMWRTSSRYSGFASGRIIPEARFEGGYPEWYWLDKIGQSYYCRIAWGFVYFFIYLKFMTSPWQLLFLIPSFVMGPLHGAIVNWCGHMYGYRNFKETHDHSCNSLPWDIIVVGELFQNNHHARSNSANFASRWWEMDPTFQVMRLLDLLGLIHLNKPKTTPRAKAA